MNLKIEIEVCILFYQEHLTTFIMSSPSIASVAPVASASEKKYTPCGKAYVLAGKTYVDNAKFICASSKKACPQAGGCGNLHGMPCVYYPKCNNGACTFLHVIFCKQSKQDCADEACVSAHKEKCEVVGCKLPQHWHGRVKVPKPAPVAPVAAPVAPAPVAPVAAPVVPAPEESKEEKSSKDTRVICFFGKICTKTGCTRAHMARCGWGVDCTNPKCTRGHPPACKNGDACTDAKCGYFHIRDKTVVECRFGFACTNKKSSCKFWHPGCACDKLRRCPNRYLSDSAVPCTSAQSFAGEE